MLVSVTVGTYLGRPSGGFMARSACRRLGTEYRSAGVLIFLNGIEKWAAARSSSGPSPHAAALHCIRHLKEQNCEVFD